MLDRALLSLDNNQELDLNSAQKIFGYFDKSQLIELFRLILKGEENKVIEVYRKIYDQGIEPKIFINDFLEILYYFKNINSLTLESTNFSLNDEEFDQIKEISSKIDNDILILFWQFTIKTLDELDIVSNQHLSIEMFLMRLIHLSGSKPKNEIDLSSLAKKNQDDEMKITSKLKQAETINQIKNVAQEIKAKPELQTETKADNKISINSFNDLIEICNFKKEIKLKYELESNINLVKFENPRIEISFNDNLDKDFVKDLSIKLFKWTNKRWLISFSKNKGEISIKDKEKNKHMELIEKAKKSDLYKTMLNHFSDAELIDVRPIKNDEDL